jgi:hypothetical protein
MGWKCRIAAPYLAVPVDSAEFARNLTGDFHMLATVAHWTHNTLLLAMALLTAALVVFAI